MLGCLKQNFPDVPVMALTATATESVRKVLMLLWLHVFLCGNFNPFTYELIDLGCVSSQTGKNIKFC